MLEQFSRTGLLLGEEAMERIGSSRVAVFGVGGVGGFTIEALARCGIGRLDIIDNDTVAQTNLNRQIIALSSTIGKYKVDVMKDRILDINQYAEVNCFRSFYLPENADEFNFSKYDYIVDAIDTITAKIDLAVRAQKEQIPIISCMGAGNKLDPTKFEVTDIYKTSVCPLAKVMRKELKKRGVGKLKVVYSKEKAIKPLESREITNKRTVPGSISFVPSVAGLIIAGEVIKDIAGI